MSTAASGRFWCCCRCCRRCCQRCCRRGCRRSCRRSCRQSCRRSCRRCLYSISCCGCNRFSCIRLRRYCPCCVSTTYDRECTWLFMRPDSRLSGSHTSSPSSKCGRSFAACRSSKFCFIFLLYVCSRLRSCVSSGSRTFSVDGMTGTFVRKFCAILSSAGL